MMLTDEVMEYLHATEEDKINIKNLIENAHNYLKSKCGEFEIEEYPESVPLIKDYVRFAWNGASEHFYDSFFQDINGLRWNIIMTDPPDEEVMTDGV